MRHRKYKVSNLKEFGDFWIQRMRWMRINQSVKLKTRHHSTVEGPQKSTSDPLQFDAMSPTAIAECQQQWKENPSKRQHHYPTAFLSIRTRMTTNSAAAICRFSVSILRAFLLEINDRLMAFNWCISSRTLFVTSRISNCLWLVYE